MTADGDTLQRHTFRYEATRMPRDAVAQLVARYATSGAPSQYIDQIREVLSAQAHLPPVSRILHVGAGDAVWLSRERLGRASVRWERFTRADGFTGYVELPWKSRIVAENDNRVWIVEKDDLDVAYLVRYRLERPGS